MRIFVIGQCTLHWGRMEFGNIGNYYVIEPFFRELHRVYPEADILTTFQMSDQFCKKVNITCVPMDEYYGWKEEDLTNSYRDYAIANVYKTTGEIIEHTPYVDDVLKSDLVIDYSGDIWGQNADLVGRNRFLIGLLKDRTAQLLGKPTVMLAGSPGPFTNDETLPFAREVFANFKFVTNREPISTSAGLSNVMIWPSVISWATPRPATISTSVATIGWMPKPATSMPFQNPARVARASAARTGMIQ